MEEHVKEGHLSFVEILITLVNHLHLGLISDDYSVQPITKQEYQKDSLLKNYPITNTIN